MERWTSRSSCALWRKPACTEGSARQGRRRVTSRGTSGGFTCNAGHISEFPIPYYCVVPYIFTLNASNGLSVAYYTDRKLLKTWAQSLVECHNSPPQIPAIIYITFAKNSKRVPSFLFGMLHTFMKTTSMLLMIICRLFVVKKFSVPTSIRWQTQYIPVLWSIIQCVL